MRGLITSYSHTEEAPLSQLDSAAIKEAFAAVVTLTIEAAKHDADTNTIT